MEFGCSAHLERCAGTLAALASQSASLSKHVSSLSALPGPGMLEILDAPETGHFVRLAHDGRIEDLVAFLEEACDAESVRYGLQGPSRRLWAAKGDACFAPGETNWFAPRLSGDVVIDTRSPRARRPLQVSAFRESSLGDATPWLTQTEGHVWQKVEDAWQLLAEISPEAHRFVRSSIRCVIPRQNLDDEEFFTSSSSRRYVGRMILLNPHLPGVSREHLVSAFVHEAIHSYLYRLEYEARFAPAELSLSAELISPWSGGRIRLTTYIHACFVYYGLASLWSTKTARMHADRNAAILAQARAVVGFKGRAFLEPLRPYLATVEPQVREQLESLSAIAQLA